MKCLDFFYAHTHKYIWVYRIGSYCKGNRSPCGNADKKRKREIISNPTQKDGVSHLACITVILIYVYLFKNLTKNINSIFVYCVS